MILRDHLALDRTAMANERTLLAYVRTSLAFAIVGASCFKFFVSLVMDALGILSIVLALVTAGIGVYRWRAVNRHLQLRQVCPKDKGL